MEKVTEGQFRLTSFVADQAGCGTIRVMLPSILLNQLTIKNFRFQAYFNNIFTKDLQYYKNSTIIQFQRAATGRHLEFFNLTRKKIKILTRSALVYEIDDNLFDIPEWNFANDYYKQHKATIIEMLTKADAITVSTQHLKQYYAKYNKNVFVVPNRLPYFIWRAPTFIGKENKKLRILYPGSSNHFSIKADKTGGDMGDELLKYIRKTTDVNDWIFVGGMPNELIDLAKDNKITRLPWCSIYEYPRILKETEPDIGIAPLQKNIFNTGKSNIKALEYTAIGIPGVFTDIEPYDKMLLKASSDEEFIEHIESLRDINRRHEVWQNTYSSMKDSMFWETNDYKNLKGFLRTYFNIVEKEPVFP